MKKKKKIKILVTHPELTRKISNEFGELLERYGQKYNVFIKFTGYMEFENIKRKGG